ncbi:MAG TPA: hypothetical protein ENH09_02470, partial [Bacteroidetes bacterium]|nr:hypothetical protein [Bacteroidota bacterium]
MKYKSVFIIGIVVIIITLILLALFAKYYGDWLWFQNMGYTSVFMTMLWA